MEQDLSQCLHKKCFQRHTHVQVQALEGFYKEFTHPDEKQRKELSQVLGLEPIQVKYWFQNKGTQMKMQQKRQENAQMLEENKKLWAKNMQYKELLNNLSCPNCGGPLSIGKISYDNHRIRLENARLHDEILKISMFIAKSTGKPAIPYPQHCSPVVAYSQQNLGTGAGHGNGSGMNTAFFDSITHTERTDPCTDELIRIATQLNEPLQTPDLDGIMELLNQKE